MKIQGYIQPGWTCHLVWSFFTPWKQSQTTKGHIVLKQGTVRKPLLFKLEEGKWKPFNHNISFFRQKHCDYLRTKNTRDLVVKLIPRTNVENTKRKQNDLCVLLNQLKFMLASILDKILRTSWENFHSISITNRFACFKLNRSTGNNYSATVISTDAEENQPREETVA